MMRAVVVLPTPRTPVSMKAWAMRPGAKALGRVRTIASWPIRSAKVARPVFAREHAIGRAAGPAAARRRCAERTGPLGSRRRRARRCSRQSVTRVAKRQTCRAATSGKRWEAGRTTRAETRYGCFLPDLTGLARRPSAANLPTHYIGRRRPASARSRRCEPAGAVQKRLTCAALSMLTRCHSTAQLLRRQPARPRGRAPREDRSWIERPAGRPEHAVRAGLALLRIRARGRPDAPPAGHAAGDRPPDGGRLLPASAFDGTTPISRSISPTWKTRPPSAPSGRGSFVDLRRSSRPLPAGDGGASRLCARADALARPPPLLRRLRPSDRAAPKPAMSGAAPIRTAAA